MNKYIKLFETLSLMMFSSVVAAEILIVGSSDFKNKVNNCLNDAKNSSVYLQKLVNSAKNEGASITVKPITNDKSTWHKSGKKSRSHTKAKDALSRGAQRNRATDSIIYINVNRITQSHKSYKSGTFIHEIVHAVDLARGNYNKDYSLREKRAVFFQNIWRQKHSKELRKDYHGRFKTLEYQKRFANGGIDEFVNYYFNNSDIP